MKKVKVLLAEDEPMIGKLIKEALELRDFDVIWATDGLKAYSAFRMEKPDICVFDVMMPHKDGFTLGKEIRDLDLQIPIIFLTARSAIGDLANGFAVGANDYIKKPFSMEELIIRMNALISRVNFEGTSKWSALENYQIGKYVFNFTDLSLTWEGESQTLSYKEAQLLKMLLDHQNLILDRKIALDHIWGDDSYFNSRSMDVFISKLRKFLEKDPQVKIINIRSKGFKLVQL